MMRVAAWLFLVALAVILTTAIHTAASLSRPMNLPEGGYVLDIPSGMSLQALSAKLRAESILPNPVVLVLYGRLSGKAEQIKAGEYDLVVGTTPRGLLEQVVAGRVKLHSLTIVEGWTVRDLGTALREHPAIRQTLPDFTAGTLAAALDLPTDYAEGWFFPDTYLFPRHTSDRDLLTMAHARMLDMLERAWLQRADDLPLQNPYQALILASIIEKETGVHNERSLVSGVFVRRLRVGMRLQTDPTVIYGLGEQFDGNLTRKHLLTDSPYNTYMRAGLPPSPISLPGKDSLLAAVRPDDSKALYFVASGNGDGTHVFSETLEEHNKAVRSYLRKMKE